MEAILCFSQAKHSHNQIIRGEILHFTQTKHSHNPWNIHGNVDRKAELNWYEYDSKIKFFFKIWRWRIGPISCHLMEQLVSWKASKLLKGYFRVIFQKIDRKMKILKNWCTFLNFLQKISLYTNLSQKVDWAGNLVKRASLCFLEFQNISILDISSLIFE